MQRLDQSTAVTLKIGPFVDETDGDTEETGLTIAQSDVRLSKNGGDIAAKNASGGGTHDELGWYDVSLDATDTATLGRLLLICHVSGALPVWHEFMVEPSCAGAGSVEVCYTVQNSGAVAVADAEVWITSDAAGTTVVAGTKETDADGLVTFYLDPGTYYRWAQKTGQDFTNPQSFVVT